MNFLQIKRIFALCIIFGLTTQVSQVHTVENTQEIVNFLTTEGAADGDVAKQYLDITEKITTLLREFVHDLQNNKKIGYYLKELNKLVKELGDKAKHLNDSNHKSLGNIHKRIYELHKNFHEFIGIIKANETNPSAISVKLMQKPELQKIIPAKAEWTIANTLAALTVRCKK